MNWDEGLSDYMAENYYQYIEEEDIYEYTSNMEDTEKMELVLFLLKSIKFKNG
ncbi:MAG: hypothetical protein GY853_00630 [PVC group bacterium]|nr:hypothetical protein [PVC group bacterium]